MSINEKIFEKNHLILSDNQEKNTFKKSKKLLQKSPKSITQIAFYTIKLNIIYANANKIKVR